MLKDYIWNGETEEVIIYGASLGGMIIAQCLEKINVQIAYFCDRRKAGKTFYGYEVKAPECLCDEKRKVLIAVNRSFASVYYFLENIKYNEIYSCESLIKDKSVEDFEVCENESIEADNFLKTYYYQVVNAKVERTEKFILPQLEVCITERCTLKCRDCGVLIPHYKCQKDYNAEQIISVLENICKVVDGILELYILGGEPLLHKNLCKFLRWAYEQDKVDKVFIITNGTILPNEEILKEIEETKTIIRISDYGEYSYKIKELVEVCEQRKIEHYVLHELWTDMGEIYNRNYTKEELLDVFRDCPFAQGLMLLKGQIWKCTHIAHMNNLNMVDSSKIDCVDFSVLEKDKVQEKRDELKKLMNVQFLAGCNYCNGMKNSIQGIQPAIQC